MQRPVTKPKANHHQMDTCKTESYNLRSFCSSTSQGMLEQSFKGVYSPMTISSGPTQKNSSKRRCPDCGASLIKRSSSSQHLLMSSTFLVCKNVVCGATFAGVDEITHRLSPPSRPNPDVELPYAPSAIRRGVLSVLGITTETEQYSTSLAPIASLHRVQQ
ncbi:ogr/Delta-like zinc finger family protein [Pseudomonas luteola]|uniref:ogr/Delta-like zinc finger family protein n=1 Tax=Pseudomonas luteola TaxID=47886 RepID=UPI002F267D2F